MKRWAIILAIVLIGSGAAVFVRAMSQADGRLIVGGDRIHDAGIVRFNGAGTVVEHTFTLVNQSGRDLQPQHVVVPCGDCDVDFDLATWKPGESRDMKVRMTLRGFGRDVADAAVICVGEQPIPVRLTAVGAPQHALKTIDGNMQIDEAGVCQRSIRFTTVDEIPPIPDIHADPHVEVQFVGWIEEMAAWPEQGVPARYRGTVRIFAPPDISHVRIRAEVQGNVLKRAFYR